ncbi:phosphatase PAP2 family protein [Paenibacillus aceris]|uniref:Membrane-associated phospholipid phosphatase n=1 Tax=Paenibacillus aceris TaxID=869555 RepID=A0ABS4HT41_9BACL|nr:phosphatase PAP2 family protein [Paenibacillus aceris]MBP1961782.1 membrane-associated phospholipid phosphatase [Paenibacillus aceris]NHW34361.1 phosphatase PAP2 family protein [Paenibacillus aceris]
MWKQLQKIVLKLDFHELLSLAMLLTLTVIYEVGLETESLMDEIFRIASTAGPITKSITLLMIIFLMTAVFVKNVRFAGHAKLLSRVMASFLVMLISFEAVVHYISARGLPLLDSALQDWDATLFFGKQPAVWLEPINNTPLTLWFSATYLSWFIFTYGSIFLMWWCSRKALLEYTTIALMTFYIGYLLYIIVPGIGPIFTYTYSTPLGGLTAMMMDNKVFTPAADVFPSLHTGISVVMLVLVWRYSRKWMWLYAPIMFSIILATVYLRIHYGVDVIAGVILSLLVAWICPKILAFWAKQRDRVVKSSLPFTEKVNFSDPNKSRPA